MLRNIYRVGLLIFFLLISACESPTESPSYYVASNQSTVFHKPDCRYVDQINAQNKITFSTRDQAINAGYRACSVCKP